MTEVLNNPTTKTETNDSVKQSSRAVVFHPRVDLRETEQELTLYAELPGVKPENVQLRYENGELALRGKVEPREGKSRFLMHEYDRGDFYRAFRLHDSIDSTRIEAEFKNGVLIVHLPKVEAVRPRQIAVKGA